MFEWTTVNVFCVIFADERNCINCENSWLVTDKKSLEAGQHFH